MRKEFFLLLLVFLMPLPAICQNEYDDDEPQRPEAYRCYLDLTKLHKDKLTVTVLVPRVGKEKTEFRMPTIVPGTYAIYNFGRFISNVKAFDSKGQALSVERADTNGWEIENANDLRTIVYDVEDTWDTGIKDNYIFEPAGSNIDSLKQYVINTFSFFGYLKDKRNFPYELYITKPDSFYASTGAQNLTSGPKNDVLKFANYDELADSPIMYCKPDTMWLNIGDTKVLISVFSPTHKAKARDLGNAIQRMLIAQKNYLGGSLPVKKYAFIIHLFKGSFNRSGSYGALEHSYSSFYYLPEMSGNALAGTISDIAAHEFFHIVTPLNIHSEQIHDFDFDKPEMSAHLWLYEGVTEYSSWLVQIQNKMISQLDFFDALQEKLGDLDNFNDTVPFTKMSKGVLGKYANEYMNVYSKGALIGLCIDIKLRQLSAGKYGVQNLMVDLAKKYGKSKPFKDEDLFKEITKLTYPEIGEFLEKYVSGNQPLPLVEIFNLVGIHYESKPPRHAVFFDGYIAYITGDNKLYIDDVSGEPHNSVLRPGDEIVQVDGKAFNLQTTLNELILKLDKTESKELTVKVKTASGNEVKCIATLKPTGGVHQLIKMANASAAQTALYKAWVMQ